MITYATLDPGLRLSMVLTLAIPRQHSNQILQEGQLQPLAASCRLSLTSTRGVPSAGTVTSSTENKIGSNIHYHSTHKMSRKAYTSNFVAYVILFLSVVKVEDGNSETNGWMDLQHLPSTQIKSVHKKIWDNCGIRGSQKCITFPKC